MDILERVRAIFRKPIEKRQEAIAVAEAKTELEECMQMSKRLNSNINGSNPNPFQ
ncbi:TPA: hypothetical protein QC160_000569 [Bacillus cereus]|uniref:hypothetical protein n=1 Tax=Bacillus TaxID=1386 RepID=UPI0007B2E7A2|nr:MULTISPECIES: hypothetical protein [Bacillus]KZD77641.1 hypothetical protein B4120_3308 [Bacillus cereus]MCI2248596.1 hypothetical protein [Bacillus cereus]MCQ6293261.1 hypothetical protein [Bacillus cereus]MCT1378746.1 hypothetical protein [Bacillus sp. p3-SID196]BCC61269.1 hypothetical protein BCJMU10_4577 [Bacillus cereus]